MSTASCPATSSGCEAVERSLSCTDVLLGERLSLSSAGGWLVLVAAGVWLLLVAEGVATSRLAAAAAAASVVAAAVAGIAGAGTDESAAGPLETSAS